MKSILVLCLLIISQIFAREIRSVDDEQDVTIEDETRSKKPKRCILDYLTPGSQQSPLDITQWSDQCYSDLIFSTSHYLAFEDKYLLINEDALVIEPDTGDAELPTVTGGPLAGTYKFNKAVFHWGYGDCGSEHYIEGNCDAAELELIYILSGYDTLDEAKVVNAGVLIVSLLFKLSCEDNPELTPIINGIDEIAENGENPVLEYDLGVYGLTFLKPYIEDTCGYFHYIGSLTQPDYEEGFPRIILHKKSKISRKQLEILRTLESSIDLGIEEYQYIYEYRRALQQRAGRCIFNCECKCDNSEEQGISDSTSEESSSAYHNSIY